MLAWFWRRKFLKIFTTYGHSAILVNGPRSFSNLFCPDPLRPKEAPHEIWATLAWRLQRRSSLKFSTFFPYKSIQGNKLNFAVKKGQTSKYDHHFSNFGRPLVPNDLCKKSAPRHPGVSFPQHKEAPYEIWPKLAQRLQRRSRLKMLTDGRTDYG